MKFEEMTSDVLGARGVLSCPPQIAEQHILWTVQDFCRRTHVYQQELYLDIQEGTTEYPIILQDNVTFLFAKYLEIGFPNNCCGDVSPVIPWYNSCTWSTRYYPKRDGYDYACNCYGRTFRIKPGNLSIEINPPPPRDVIKGLKFVFAVMPTAKSCEFPDEIYAVWSEALSLGASARITAMSKQPWTNVAMSKQYRMEYEAAISQCKNDTWRTSSGGPLIARGSTF